MNGPPPALAAVAALAALALLSMAVFAWLGAGRDADATRKQTRFALDAGQFLVHWFMWVLRPVERLALSLGVTPDALNLTGLLLGVLAGLAVGTGRLEWGGVGLGLGGICDVLDGRVARARGVENDYGRFMDSTLDRFFEVFALLGFAVFLSPLPGGALATAAALGGSLLVSYTRARGESVGVVCREGLMQRAERMVLLTLVCLTDTPLSAWLGRPRGTAALWTMALIALGTLATAVHRAFWIGRRLRERESERDATRRFPGR